MAKKAALVLIALCSIPAMAAYETWDSTADYSSTQGYHDWSYMYWDVTDDAYHEMTWGVRDVQIAKGWPLTSIWYAPVAERESCVIYGDGMHPLQYNNPTYNPGARELHPARVWTAPREMPIDISIAVVDDYQNIPDANGDGIYASVSHNDSELWQQHIAYQTLTPVEAALQLNVSAGDEIRFEVAPGPTDYYDHFDYRAEIQETPEVSAGFLLVLGLVAVAFLWRSRNAAVA